MTAEVTALEQLAAIEALRSLQSRVCRHAGAREWDEFERLFTENAQLRAYGADGELECFAVSPGIGAAIGSRLAPGPFLVHAGGAELTVCSPDRAEGVWWIEDVVPAAGGAGVVRGFGSLHASYERRGERWLVRSADVVRRFRLTV